MLRKIIFKNNKTGQEIVLPVTPQSFEVETGCQIETVNLHTAGDYTMPGGRTLFSATISSFFPAQAYPFVNAGALANPQDYIDFFASAMKWKQVCRFAVSDSSVVRDVYIQSLRYGEQDGTNDVYYTLTMREYQPISEEAAAAANTDAVRTTPLTIAAPETYTVKKGDTLSSICNKFYGDASLYPKIAEVNHIANPHLIYPGDVLTLPDKNSL